MTTIISRMTTTHLTIETMGVAGPTGAAYRAAVVLVVLEEGRRVALAALVAEVSAAAAHMGDSS